jgi:polysaccharide pyruvyl transferase WcaK-like protein
MPLFDRLRARATDFWRESVGPIDTDLALQGSMAALIEASATRYAVDPGAQYEPGGTLKLLFTGYAGSRNTGADVRVEEMIRQFRHLLGDDVAELSILTIDPERTKTYFPTVRQLTLPSIFPRFMFDTVHQHHGVIACEGSMFKSKFANALSTLMVGGLGLASAENKLAIGYGGEAGKMDPSLEAMVRRYCRDAWILARNDESVRVLGDLGIEAKRGTDTAWTFEVGPERGEQALRNAGWDGRQPVLAVCPINPFWWPVKPDLLKGTARYLMGAWEDDHYTSVYFHASNAEIRRRNEAYLDAIAEGVNAFAAEEDVFVALIGMEMLDRRACDALNTRLTRPAPLFVSDDHDLHTMVSVLRRCSYLLSSRYHAIVCSMPAAVPSAGITMDERIRNLMVDRGTPELALEVDDPELGPRVLHVLRSLKARSTGLQLGIEACVATNLRRMGQMGVDLVDHLRSVHPDLPIAPHFGGNGDPLAHLPPAGPSLQQLLERSA